MQTYTKQRLKIIQIHRFMEDKRLILSISYKMLNF